MTFANLYHGANFPSGLTSGSFFLPNKNGPGVPIGTATPYRIKPKNATVLFSEEVDATPDKQFITLLEYQSEYATVQTISSSVSALCLDYSRLFTISLNGFTPGPDVSVTIGVSYIDMYLQIGYYEINLASDVVSAPLLCIKGFVSISYVCTNEQTFTLSFETTTQFELPFNDLGLESQLLGVWKTNISEKVQSPHIWTTNDSDPYVFGWAGLYYPALQTPPTATQSATRPSFTILSAPGTFFPMDDNYIFVFLQNVYGTGNATTFIDETMPNVSNQSYEFKNIYGYPNYSIGFTEWVG